MDDPLSQVLRPLHEPAPIGVWPPAPGWWALTLVLAAGCVLAFLWYRSRAPQRAALAELKDLETAGASVAVVNRLLKRYALVCFPRSQVAALTGRAWLDFLLRHGGRDLFTDAAQDAILTEAYRGGRAESGQRGDLYAAARRWIKANGPKAFGVKGRAR